MSQHYGQSPGTDKPAAGTALAKEAEAAAGELVIGDATEPLLSRSAITAVAGVLVSIGLAWGLPLTHTQENAVNSALIVAGTMAAAWWGRRHVNSPKSTRKALTGR